MDNFNDIVGNAKKAAYRLDKEFGQNSKVQIFVNMRWDIDFLCLKKTRIYPLVTQFLKQQNPGVSVKTKKNALFYFIKLVCEIIMG